MKALMLGMLGALGIALGGMANEDTMKVPLHFETLDNVVADGGLLRLRHEYKQEGAQPLVFEAEEATIIELQSTDKRIMKDAQASGGHYIHYVKKMEYDFMVETPGQYQVRCRSWFPLKAPYSHSEYMDDGEINNVTDSQLNDQEVWFWTQGNIYELNRGPHRYVFPSPTAFCAGARLDKVVLLPVGKSDVQGFGPPSSPLTTPLIGMAVTKRISLRRIKAWQLSCEISLNEGKAAVEYSFDKETWMAAPCGKFLEVAQPKPRFLYFRFTLNGKAGQPSPWIEGLELHIKKEQSL